MQYVTEQLALATDKVSHCGKRAHADAMLAKWQSRLSALQSKDRTQPTSKTASGPACPGSEHLAPRAAH